MTTPTTDPNPTPGDRKRAGMAVRAWKDNDLDMVGLVAAEARETGRGFHLYAALLTELVEVLHLRDSPEASALLDQAIARYAAEEQARLDAEDQEEDADDE